MSILEEIGKASTDESQNIRYDTTAKIEMSELGMNFDLEKEFEELERDAKEVDANPSFVDRLLSLEVVLNFKNKQHMVYLLGFFAAAAGLLSGLDQSIISGASIGMKKDLKLTTHEQSLISSLMPLGAMAGSMIMTPLNEIFGRKAALIISCIWYTIGAGLCAGSHSHHMMYAGRFILGVGVGIEGGCVGIYISESVPANVRGSIVSMYQFNIALGEVLGYAVAAMFYSVKGGWRFMVGSSLVFSTALFIGLFFLPESPRWLVHKGKYGMAYKVWKRLRDISDDKAKLEFLEMRQAAYEEHDRRAHESKFSSWVDLFTIARNRRALNYAVIMVTLGQLTGVNAVMYYMSTLMGAIGFNEKNSVFMSLVGGGSLLIGTIPAILWMDRYGRRLWGYNIIGFFVGLVLVGVGYRFNPHTHKAAAEGVYLSGLILYFLFFGSYSTLTWVVPSESFDLKTRSLGMTICSSFLYLWSFTVTYNFAKMKQAFTYTGLTLGFYGGIAFIGLIYQMLFMPETKDKTLEEIDDIFSRSSFSIARENLANIKKGKFY
ncbi:Sugar (and other) transporter family protein [Clavispora lusitaniae]|uniref:Myo-inositol transporter n=1 Tax=Clavispora lusitaniae TaxID=36911 RepID=A0AA91Q4E1_CLALS|nr:Sugar (and other) transporter family protein [Clavispora lusitaniae]OVF10755.1 putative myo-inositol transporter [Clavispora lusitaniae]